MLLNLARINTNLAFASSSNSPAVQSPTLELVLESDPLPHDADPSLHPITGERQIPFHLLQADYHLNPPVKPMGRISPEVLLEMIAFEEHRHFPVFSFFPRLSATIIVPGAVRSVAFDPKLVKMGQDALSLGMEALVWFMRSRGSMKARAYIYPMFADPRSVAFADRSGMQPWENVGLTVFRNSSPYFGSMRIGVSLIVYEGEGDDMMVWIQKRSAHTTCGGLLDTTAGGAVESGKTAWEGMSKEAEEEATLSDAVIRRYCAFLGGLSFYLDPEEVPKPVVHLCFDLKRPDPSAPDYDATLPQICDDEVQEFRLMSIPEIQQALQGRKFAPSAVPDLIYFLYQKGFISRETEPYLDAILKRCQRTLDVAIPHRLLDFEA